MSASAVAPFDLAAPIQDAMQLLSLGVPEGTVLTTPRGKFVLGTYELWYRVESREGLAQLGRGRVGTTEHGLAYPVTIDLPVKPHGDPAVGGDGITLAIDADCPHCGWPERIYNTSTRRFCCIKCTYTSDERNA